MSTADVAKILCISDLTTTVLSVLWAQRLPCLPAYNLGIQDLTILRARRMVHVMSSLIPSISWHVCIVADSGISVNWFWINKSGTALRLKVLSAQSRDFLPLTWVTVISSCRDVSIRSEMWIDSSPWQLGWWSTSCSHLTCLTWYPRRELNPDEVSWSPSEESNLILDLI